MPRGQRNNVNAGDAPTTRTTRPRLTDEQKAIAEVEKLQPRVTATKEKLKKVRAQAAELDEQLKADEKLLTWALQNPFLPKGYGDQADVPAGDAESTPADDDTTAIIDATSDEGEQDDIPGASVVAEAAEERIEQSQADESDDDDPFAGH